MMFLLPFALAQDALSLQEALAMGPRASESLRIAEAEAAAADADRSAAFGGFLPSVGGAVNYNHTFKSEYDGLFDTGDTGDTTATGYTGGAAAANPFADLPFGKKDTWRADLSLSQVVYGGGRVRAQYHLAKEGQVLASLGFIATEASTTFDVATAYLDAQLADRFVAISRDALAQAEVTLAHATAAHSVGRQPEFEVLRARVEVENQRVIVLQQGRIQSMARLRLGQVLGIGDAASIVLTTPLEAEVPNVSGSGATVRIVERIADGSVEVARAAVALSRSSGLPQVGISAAAGVVAYPDDPLPPTEDWRTNVSAGAGVSMPIFSGGVIRAQIRAAQADLASAQARATQVAELAALDTQDALGALTAARAQWEATAGTVTQAQRAYAIGEVRFQEGLSTQAELADARLLLQRALANRAQAGHDLQLASLRVQLLPELPLSSR